MSKAELEYIESDSTIETKEKLPWKSVLPKRQTWAFATAKLTDAVWWFYLFWGTKFLHSTFDVSLADIGVPFFIMYMLADGGSILGGWISGNSGYFWAFLVAGSCYLIILGLVHLLMPKMTPLDKNLKPIEADK